MIFDTLNEIVTTIKRVANNSIFYTFKMAGGRHIVKRIVKLGSGSSNFRKILYYDAKIQQSWPNATNFKL